MKKRLIQTFLTCAAGATLISGCSTIMPKCTEITDTPVFHYQAGMKALEDRDIKTAQEKFQRALYCDDSFSIAHSGMAIVSAEKAKAQQNAGFRTVELDHMTAELGKAKKTAKLSDQLFDYYTADIRSKTAVKTANWLDNAKDAYDDGTKLSVDERKLSYYLGTEAISYFMGVAWMEGKEYQKARDAFGTVLNSKREGKWHEKADKGWKRVDKIVRAMGGITPGDVGKAIAPQEVVSRADLAALIIEDLKIDKIMAGRIPLIDQSGRKAEFTPADMINHPFKAEVLTLMKWKVRGMEPKFDEASRAYLFKPLDPVTRGEMALILEDVLIKLTGNDRLASSYLGQENSPFPDVKATSALYNAVMNMTTRNIMEGELSGEFRVNAPVDGAEALLAIRVLKQRVNTY